jgi:putative membrane protein
MARDETKELAQSRTNLAEDRTILANERTFAGWMRTGLATVGIGLGFNALFAKIEPPWVPKATATAFLLIGIFIFIVASRRARAVLDRFHPHQIQTFKSVNIRLMTYVIVAATLALIAGLWTLE